MKYLTAIYLILVGFGLLLSACQSTPVPSQPALNSFTPTKSAPQKTPAPTRTPLPTDTPTPTMPVSAIGVDPEALEGIEVQFGYPVIAGMEPLTQALVDQFNRENEWGIQVSAQAYPSMDEFVQVIETGVLPDIFAAYTYQARLWDPAGNRLEKLDLYIEDPVWGVSEAIQSSLWQAEQVRQTHNDLTLTRHLGLPWFRIGVVLLYNETWAQALGFETAPTNSSEFREQACAAAEANLNDNDSQNNGRGGWFVSRPQDAFWGWLQAFGSSIADYEANDYQFLQESSAAALLFIQQMNAAGCAWMDQSLTNNAYDYFVERQALFVTASLVELDLYQQALAQVQNQDAWKVLPFLGPAGERTVPVYGPSLYISQATPQDELAAWIFLRWLVAEEQQSFLTGQTGYFPVLEDGLAANTTLAELSEQQQAALLLHSQVVPEPSLSSWDVFRWALGDALTEAFLPEVDEEAILDILQRLDALGAELQKDLP